MAGRHPSGNQLSNETSLEKAKTFCMSCFTSVRGERHTSRPDYDADINLFGLFWTSNLTAMLCYSGLAANVVVIYSDFRIRIGLFAQLKRKKVQKSGKNRNYFA